MQALWVFTAWWPSTNEGQEGRTQEELANLTLALTLALGSFPTLHHPCLTTTGPSRVVSPSLPKPCSLTSLGYSLEWFIR